MEKDKDKKTNKVKEFISRLANKVDKKMEEKAKSQKSCCGDNSKDGSCCS